MKGIVVVGGHWNRCQHQVTGVSKRPGPGNLLSLGTITMASSPEDGPGSRTDHQRALDEAWNNPANWVTVCGHRVLYHSLIDPRIVVQKAPLHVGSIDIPLGWTFNFAHTESHVAVIVLAAAAWRLAKRLK